jgi:antitoxin YefM
MTQVTYTELRQNLARYLDEAVDNRAPITVTRQGGKEPVVLMALSDFEGWQETVHLLSDPVNAALLLESIRQLDAGQSVPYDPDQPIDGGRRAAE